MVFSPKSSQRWKEAMMTPINILVVTATASTNMLGDCYDAHSHYCHAMVYTCLNMMHIHIIMIDLIYGTTCTGHGKRGRISIFANTINLKSLNLSMLFLVSKTYCLSSMFC